MVNGCLDHKWFGTRSWDYQKSRKTQQNPFRIQTVVEIG